MPNNDGQLDFNFKSESAPRPAHNFRSVINDFKVWNIVGSGVSLNYSSNIDLKNGLILGKPQRPTSSGVYVNDSSKDLHFNRLHIEDFVNGIKVPYDANKDFVGSQIQNSYFANNQNNFATTRGEITVEPGAEDFPAFFQIGQNNTFNISGSNVAPTAKFSSQVIGGLARQFDAGESYDNDSSLKAKASKGIVSYGWDFNNDGNIDKFGRQISHHFDRAGSYNVSLTVWDDRGASKSLTKTIDVKQANYQNAIIDSNFGNNAPFISAWNSSSQSADLGWFASSGVKRDANLGNGGAAVLSGVKRSVIGQTLYDQSMRRGIQTLSLDVKNTEGDLKSARLNEITINVWGINGEFNNNSNPYQDYGPYQAGALPMRSEKLVEQTIGGSSFDWKKFRWDVDLGDGYEFLMLQVVTDKAHHSGDFIAIDNVQLK